MLSFGGGSGDLGGEFVALEAEAQGLPGIAFELQALAGELDCLVLAFSLFGILGDLDAARADNDAVGMQIVRGVDANGETVGFTEMHLNFKCAVRDRQRAAQGGGHGIARWFSPNGVIVRGPLAGCGDPRFAGHGLQSFIKDLVTAKRGQFATLRGGFIGHGWQLAAVAAVAVAVQQGGELLHDLGVLHAEVLRLGRVLGGVVELGVVFISVSLSRTGLDLVHWLAFDPFPRSFADGKDTISTVDDHVLADRFGRIARDGGQEAMAVLDCLGGGWQRLAHDLCGGGHDVGKADHLLAHTAGRGLAGPAHDEGHLEAAFPHVVLAAAQGAIGHQSGVVGLGGPQVFALKLLHAAVVAAEDDQGVVRDAHFIKRAEDATHTAVELMNPVAIQSGSALAREILVRRDGCMNRDRREVEEEWRVLGLLLQPVGGLFRERLHDALVLAARGVEIEDLAGVLRVLHVFRAVGFLEVVVVNVRSGQFHAVRDFAGAQPIDEAVLHEDTREIAVIAGHAEVVVKADVERSRCELSGVVRAPVQRALGVAISEVPFADGSRRVTVLLQHGSHVQPGGLDVQRREGSEHLMLQGRAPAVASRHHRIARRRAYGRRGVRIREPAAFRGEPVDARRLHQCGIRAVAARATVAVIVREDDDDVGLGRCFEKAE